MNSKKLLALVCCLTFVTAGLTSCNNDKDTNTIKIQFVPSNDPSTLGGLADRLEPVLHSIVPEYNFDISVGTSYVATTQGLLSNQLDIGFLTASGYAQATLENPGKVDVLLTSVRKGYKVQVDDFAGLDAASREKQALAMNGLVDNQGNKVEAGASNAYKYLGEQSEKDVNWYTSQLTVTNAKYVDKNNDGKIDVKDMAGLKIGRMGATSGAGYLRPLKYLHDFGMTMVDQTTYDKASDADKANMIIGIEQTDYGAAFNSTQDGTIDGFWGFTDVRYAQGYTKNGSAYYQKEEAFTKTKVVAITDSIYNDTISCRSNLEDAKKQAVVKAFKQAITMTDKIEGGDMSPSEILYKVYSHTGYSDAKDSDFNGEREFYQFCVDNDLIK